MNRTLNKNWSLAVCDPDIADQLSKSLLLHPIVAKILTSRDLTDPKEVKMFLKPSLADLTPPDRMADLDKAAKRLIQAIKDQETIVIYGDYDVDGVTSTSLLINFFAAIGVEARHYIPDRLSEGYGVNEKAVELLAQEGCQVLITVDCGISDIEAIRRAGELGLDVIVTDHHRVGEELPPAYAVIDPNRPDCEFPFKNLAGVGVAFYLIVALRTQLREQEVISQDKLPNLAHFLDLVALGTVADIVSLTGCNRILVHYGITLLTEEHRVGIKAIKEVSGIGKKPMGSGAIAFQIAPRINAAGRLGNASMGVRMLTTQTVSEALQIAHKLDEINYKRRNLESRILDEAVKMIDRDPTAGSQKSIVLSSTSWHPGVIGIVCSRLVAQYNKPVILIAVTGGKGTGSARSISQFDIHQGIAQCADLLITFGGHPMAAGLRLKDDRIKEFKERFEQEVVKGLTGVDSKQTQKIDCEVTLDQLDSGLVEGIAAMAPFGIGNPEPVLASRGLRVDDLRIVGRHHLKFKVSDNNCSIEAIWFQMGPLRNQITEFIDLAYQPRIDEYQGSSRLILHIKDLHPAKQLSDRSD